MSKKPRHTQLTHKTPRETSEPFPSDSKRLELLESFELHINLTDRLRFHYFNEMIRPRVVDWMIEVLYLYKTSERTLYLAVKLLDIYLARTYGLEAGSLQRVSVTCMFMASKYEDVHPLSLDCVCSQIAGDKVSRKHVIATEREVLCLVDYNLFLPTIHDWLEVFMHQAPSSAYKFAWVLADISLLSSSLAGIPTRKAALAIAHLAKVKTGVDTPTLADELTHTHNALLERYEAYKVDRVHFRAICIKYQIYNSAY